MHTILPVGLASTAPLRVADPLHAHCPTSTSFCSMVAVSHGYAWECQTQEGGWGLHAVFQEHAWKLRGGWGLLISVDCR